MRLVRVRTRVAQLLLMSVGVLPIGYSSPAAAAEPLVRAPLLSRPVMDEAQLLDEATKTRVEAALRDLRDKSGAQMAIYIPDSLQGIDIESFTMSVAEQWKLGKKGDDKGILLVLAPRDRRVRLEVGYGLEGVITDARSKRLLDETLVPYMRAKQPGEGLVALASGIGGVLGVELGTAPAQLPRRYQRTRSSGGFSRGTTGFALIFPLLFVFFLVLRLSSSMGPSSGIRRRGVHGSRGGWGGWSSGGGFGGGGGGFSGGGGGFGGGGASSNW